ncbi:MAG: phosphoribosylanthranilate isomerase [candidate division WOR-3 bacterium]
MNTKVKICGITNLKDALLAVESGADALGFIFAPSPRRITPRQARHIIKHLPPFISAVGVFMDTPLPVLRQIIEISGIDTIQLHGHEPPEYCSQIKKLRIIKRIMINPDSQIKELIKEMTRYRVSAYLFDPGAGSGKIFDWQMIKGLPGRIIIAGGLTPDNVCEAIALLKPYGVDVCSGVENSIGRKDPEKLKAFIREVRRCI